MNKDNLYLSLSKLEPDNLPLSIFNQIARLTVTPVLEVVPLHKDSGGLVKVLLMKKPENDLFWAGMYHVPGTIILTKDGNGSLSDALRRVILTRLSQLELKEHGFVDVQLCKVRRGTELAVVYMVELIAAPPKHLLFDVNDLPTPLIEGQQKFIKKAVLKLMETSL